MPGLRVGRGIEGADGAGGFDPIIQNVRARRSERRCRPGRNVTLVDDSQAKLRQLLRDFRTELTKNSENVGDRFPEVARKMHSEEVERRTIHGRATAEEAKALVDEGVAVQPLPAFPDDLN